MYGLHNWVGGLVPGVPCGHMCELNQIFFNPLRWEIYKEPYPIENGVLTIPKKWESGNFYRNNPVFEALDLPFGGASYDLWSLIS